MSEGRHPADQGFDEIEGVNYAGQPGSYFCPYEDIGQEIPTSNLPLRFGKGWMYEGGIRVPAIIKYPKQMKAGIKTDQVIVGYDFYPTLLSLAVLPLQAKQYVDGLDIFDSNKKVEFQSREMFWYYPLKHASGHTSSAAMRQGDHKLILDLKMDGAKLYNIKNDISEHDDLSMQNKELTLSMKNRLVSFLNLNKPVKK
jgi:arylsulfatase A-like enzyme